jgi:hypothetical protein
VTIGNTGSTGLTVTGLTITGSSDFTLNAGTPAPPFTVAAAASTSVLVNYTPSGSGADSGSLAIASNDPDEALVSVELGRERRTCQPGHRQGIYITLENFHA